MLFFENVEMLKCFENVKMLTCRNVAKSGSLTIQLQEAIQPATWPADQPVGPPANQPASRAVTQPKPSWGHAGLLYIDLYPIRVLWNPCICMGPSKWLGGLCLSVCVSLCRWRKTSRTKRWWSRPRLAVLQAHLFQGGPRFDRFGFTRLKP